MSRVGKREKRNEGIRRRRGILFWFATIVLLCVMCFSAYKIITILQEYKSGTELYEEVQSIAGTDKADEGKKEFKGKVNFDALKKKNKDVQAWLYSKGTVINYPVVQGEDNEFYLYRMVNKSWNSKGTLFIDYRCKRPFKDFLTVIYGHRMKDGSMFHSLVEYRDKNYLKKHPYMILSTPNKIYRLEVFGVVTIPADSNRYKMDFVSSAEKREYLEWIGKKGEVDTGVEATADDKIVMLSTCTYEFDDARLVVFGKLKEMKAD